MGMPHQLKSLKINNAKGIGRATIGSPMHLTTKLFSCSVVIGALFFSSFGVRAASTLPLKIDRIPASINRPIPQLIHERSLSNPEGKLLNNYEPSAQDGSQRGVWYSTLFKF